MPRGEQDVPLKDMILVAKIGQSECIHSSEAGSLPGGVVLEQLFNVGFWSNRNINEVSLSRLEICDG